jgi:signal transduction histidine kinase
VVDDEPTTTQLLAKLLAKQHEVIQASSGSEGLQRLADAPVDVIIADQRMPGMTGMEFLAVCRERYPDAVRMMLTAYTDPDVIVNAINQGEVYRFLHKPWKPAELRLEVQQAVERVAMQRENARLVEELRRNNDDLNASLEELAQARGKLLESEKLALAGRFASGFLHDVRNYMAALSTTGLFGERYKEDRELQLLVEFIDRMVRDMREMVGELGSLSRGEIPKYELVPREVSEVLRDALNVVRHSVAYQGHGVELEGDSLPGVPVAASRLRRVFMNLLQNAAEASPDGEVIRVRMYEEGDDACVAITNGGSGIAPDTLEHIWEPFFTTKTTGTGLGLDICQIIVTGHGGRIEVSSKPGATTFTVRLNKSLD